MSFRALMVRFPFNTVNIFLGMSDAKPTKAVIHNPKIRTGIVTAGKQTKIIKQPSKQTCPSSPMIKNLNFGSFSSAAELVPGFICMCKQTWRNSFSFYRANSNILCLKANKITSDLSWIFSEIVSTILKQNLWLCFNNTQLISLQFWGLCCAKYR